VTPARLAQIRANLDAARRRNDDVSRAYVRDVGDLLAEVEQVRVKLADADRVAAETIRRSNNEIIADRWEATAKFQQRALVAEAEVARLNVLLTASVTEAAQIGSELSSSRTLMSDLHDILDRAGLPPRDGYSLRERVRLAAEQGLPIGAPDPAWEPCGGLLRTWWRDYRDGTIGTVQGAPDGGARWWRGEPGTLALGNGTESREPYTIAEGTADSKRATMQAADNVTL